MSESARVARPGGLEHEVEEPEVESVPRRRVVEATRSLSALLAAGLPLTKALETTRDVVGGPAGTVFDEVLGDVRRGRSLADALSAHPRAFDPLYVGVVRAGERSGRLASIVGRLADELERQDELHQRIVSASIYPAALVVLGGCSILLLLLFVVPRFAEMLVEAGAELPAMTAALMGTSTFLRTYWVQCLAASGAAVVGLAAYTTSSAGRRGLATAALHVPLVGPVRRGLLAARFARLLGVLLDGGAPLVVGLANTADSMADPVAEGEIRRIREDVRTGASFARSVASGDVFPTELSRLVAVGEESGRLAEFLGRAADLYERRSVRATERAVTLLEPLVIVLFGGIVAVVALALLQAIYGVNAGSFG